MKHILSAEGWTKEEIECLFRQAEVWREEAFEGRVLSPQFQLPDFKVTCWFPPDEPSTRTHDSYAEAARLLGCPRGEVASGGVSSMAKDETYSRTAIMEAGYNAAVLVARLKPEGAARWLAEMLEEYGYHTAIHNGGDGGNKHPSQALLDLYTIWRRLGMEFKPFSIAFVGDLRNSRVVHSFMDLARLLPVHRITLVSSSETRLQKWYQKELPVEEADSLEAIRGCDFVDVLRVQRERFEGGENSLEYQRAKGRFRIGPREIEMAGRDTLFMHPQPIADNEIDPSVWRHKQVIMDEEARNGVPIRMAAIAQSVRRLDQKDFSEPPSPCVKELWSGAAAERTRRKHNEERYYHLLTHGTAIDHLAPDCGEVVRTHLRRRASEQGGVTVLTEGLRTQRMVGGRKDRLALEGRFLTPDEMAFVQFLCPQATFNEIREGTLSKRRLTEGGHIRGLLRCPNPKCITNCDAEARLHPHFQVPRGETDLCICHFCEQRFTRVEMLAELKK